MFGIGQTELILFLMLILIVVSANHLPKVGKNLTESLLEGKKSSDDSQNE